MNTISKIIVTSLSFCTIVAMAGDVTSMGTGGVYNASSGGLDYANAIPMESKVSASAISAVVGNAGAPNLGKPGSSAGSPPVSKTKLMSVSVPVPEMIKSNAAVVAPQEYGDTNHPFSTSRVDPFDKIVSNKYPNSAAGKLYFHKDGGTYVCSAALIQPGVVVTAAHCVAEFGENTFYSDWEFIPAYRSGKAPFGKWYVKDAAVMTSYLDGTDDCTVSGVVCQNDVAVLALKRKTKDGGATYFNVGDNAGWLGYGYNGWGQVTYSRFGSDSIIQTTQLGYPMSHDSGQLMQRTDSTGYTDTAAQDNSVIGSRQTGGSSGGPWIANFGQIGSLSGTAVGTASDSNMVIGVTSWGYQDQKWKEQGASPFTDGNIVPLVDYVCTNYSWLCE